MLYVMYVWIPAIINLLVIFLLSKLKVEKANRELRENAPLNYQIIDR